MSERWSLRVDPSAETVTVDDANVNDLVLVVPPHLENKARRFFAEHVVEVWWQVWDAFHEDGLQHPRHGKWYQCFDEDKGKGYCCQYILRGFQKFFMQRALSICQLPEGHAGKHRCQWDEGVIEWDDDEADIVNDPYWRRLYGAGT